MRNEVSDTTFVSDTALLAPRGGLRPRREAGVFKVWVTKAVVQGMVTMEWGGRKMRNED
jgi:hypothetical protein